MGWYSEVTHLTTENCSEMVHFVDPGGNGSGCGMPNAVLCCCAGLLERWHDCQLKESAFTGAKSRTYLLA